MNYGEALRFIGEVRAGISWKRFCIEAVSLSDTFIEFLNGTDQAKEFLSSKGIGSGYAAEHIRNIFSRLHFNPENDHYLTLALPYSSSESRIHKRWKELMLIYHPDRSVDGRSAECAARINEAYNVLKNPEKKQEYDRQLRLKRDGRLKRKEMAAYRVPSPEEHFIISPRTKSRLSRLIIPLCIVISFSVLLVIFLENRKEDPFYQGRHQDKGDGKLVPGTKSGQGRAAVPQETAALNLADAAPGDAPAQREVPVKRMRNRLTDPGRVTAGNGAGGTLKSQPSSLPKDPPAEKAAKAQERTPAMARTTSGVASGLSEVHSPEKKAQKKFEDRPREERHEPSAPAVQPLQAAAAGDSESLGTRVNRFLERYARAYEEGDLEGFLSLYSKSAVENNRLNYEEIKRAYRKNFEAARYRYTLGNVRFGKKGEHIVVSGLYTVRKLPRSGEEVEVRGDIRWTLAEEGGSLRIMKVDYDSR
ncbi:MAG: DnaJ domain-containing protein [Nitrospirae bacterium]|nr:DnaJ domain-containing protein [Nitrospirota bacterium]